MTSRRREMILPHIDAGYIRCSYLLIAAGRILLIGFGYAKQRLLPRYGGPN